MAIYLDNNATTQPLTEVVEGMAEVLREAWQNPSSPSSAARRVRSRIEEARAHVGGLVGVPPEFVRFTSGGTEANAIAVFAALENQKGKRDRVVFSAVEHSSILSLVPVLEKHGYRVDLVPVCSDGRIDVEVAFELIDERTALVSVQWVNNETGTVQPIEVVAARCRQVGCLFHTDAAQAVGKLLQGKLGDLRPDFLTLTAHKFHGPTGAGALVGANPSLRNPFWSGSQELGVRPGTENVPGIVGLGVAARLRLERLESVVKRLAWLRDSFEQQVCRSLPDVQINGTREFRVCNTTNLRFPDVPGEALRNSLDLAGLQCSMSSACMTARPEPSHVLIAMGLSEDEAFGSLRFSFSERNSQEEVREAACLVSKHYEILRQRTAQLVA